MKKPLAPVILRCAQDLRGPTESRAQARDPSLRSG